MQVAAFHRPVLGKPALQRRQGILGAPIVSRRSPTIARRLSAAARAAAVEAPTAPPTAAPDAAPTDAAAAPAASDAPDSASELFNWQRCWYPLAAVEYLDTRKPNAAKLLGKQLVLWKDGGGAWRAHEDLCPHRLAPLSEGRIHEDGTLQCTYHGWKFDGAGACTSIPQFPDAKAHATATASPRSCVRSYPTQVLQGMLWVYADPSPEGWAASKAEDGAPSRPLTASTELLDKGFELKAPWYQRDAPLSLDILIENMTDPSHVPQSHHGVMGDRESNQEITIEAQGPLTVNGFSMFVKAPPGTMGDYTFHFIAPSLTKYHFPGPVTMLLYAVPTEKGWSRVIMSFIGPKDSKARRPGTPALPPFVNWLIDHVIDPVPIFQHLVNRNPVMDGDNYFMHYAQNVLYSRGTHEDWARQYYLPATADLGVSSWRKWIDRHGCNLPVLLKSPGDVPPMLPREVVFDVYNQHTKHCPHCRAGLRNATIGAAVSGVFAVVAAAATVVAAAALFAAAGAAGAASPATALVVAALQGAGAKFVAASAAFAAVCGAVTAALLKLRQAFIYQDYVHAER